MQCLDWSFNSMDTYPASILELSHSTLGSFDSCPRKLEFSKLFGFRMRDRSKASSGGNALHAATGAYLATKDKNKAIEKLLLSYPIDLCSNPMWSWSLESCYAALLSIFNFIDTHPELELAIIDDKPAIEVPFIINIQHNISSLMPTVYRGYIDFIFYNRLENSYFVMDLKGTAANTQDFTPMYRWDSQCLPYGLVLNSVLDKSIKTLEVSYLIAKVDVANPSTVLLEFEKTEIDIEEWARNLYLQLFIIDKYIKSKWFPRNSKGCMAYNRKCKYFTLCESRKLSTINLMLQSIDNSQEQEFNPWVTIDMELAHNE